MSVNEKMTAIADAIRGFTGGKDKLSLDAMAAAITDVFAAGEAVSDEKHNALYKVDMKQGSGTGTMEFDCPFEPDAVYIATWSPLFANTENMFHFCLADFRSFARQSGFLKYFTTSILTSMISSSSLGNILKYENNKLAFVAPSSLSSVTFRDCVNYVFIAVKYTDKDDYTLLAEEVALLPSGGGSVTFSEKRINETVTEEEWEEMIAPAREAGWTISLV
ncbi:MAG: hypothetical protein IJN48_00395 [Clostridia bacterium]|nr:hypothetical protein [Clostridia bacterium]